MAKLFNKMGRVRQKTSVHCGPAAVEMLISYLGGKVNQDEIVSKTGVKIAWFKTNGLKVRELKNAVNKLFPHLEFWYKRNSKISDLSKIVNKYKFPVGIEWQGVFDYTHSKFDPKYGEEDDDPGHYSVVTAIDIKRDLMKIADPERHYAGHDRKFAVSFFKKRWWDVNDVKIKGLKKVRKIRDDRMMFVIVPKLLDFPRKMGMIKR